MGQQRLIKAPHDLGARRCELLQPRPAVGAQVVAAPFSPSDPWVVWAALAAAGALGLWSEKTKVGKALSGALVATLLGLLMSNVGLIPCDAPQYAIVNKMLLPLAIPMLLFAADLRRVFFDTGRLLSVFLLGSVATVVATLVAFKLMPLASLGPDSWKIASALCARHIGGAVNYVGVVETLGVSPASQAAGLAADNLICALYFTTLYWLARRIPPDEPAAAAGPGEGCAGEAEEGGGGGIGVLEGGTAIAVSAFLCMLGTAAAKAVGYSGLAIPIITLLAVLLATAIPAALRPIVSSGEGLAALIMQVFFATVGANGNIGSVIQQAPSLFIFSLLQAGVHLAVILAVGKAVRVPLRDLLIASNANVGGPTTAAGMAAAKKWRRSVVPALLVGTFGYAIATFVSIALGFQVLQPMAG